ncbi:hypothetical protein [Mycobacterium sp.]|uniref:hypothetical protein n=1 Tax=Mycobacterium sp. TaxID=1785 RepID=UPI003D6B2905
MSGQRHQTFVDELRRFTVEIADTRWAVIAERLTKPLRVAVSGRRGVGRRTVAQALACAGVDLARPPDAADLEVYVIAEVAKPEDRDAIAASRYRVLTVLNKADLTDKPAGVPAEPMVGLLAVAVLDDTRWAELKMLSTRPTDLSSPDSFLTGDHPLPVEVRRRLLDTFDLFGITQAIGAMRRGESKTQVQALLRRLSRIDAVVDEVTAACTEVHYRRMLGAVAELEALAVTDPRAADFLSRDDTVIARMAAALDVVEAAGLPVERCSHRAALLQQAARWQRYSRGPVSATHRVCGADIARGSLRLWSRASSGSPPISRVQNA